MSEELTPDLASGDSLDAPPSAPPPPKRGPGHRGQDIRDTVAEMAAKAHEISLEAGSKMAAAMRDVVGAAAGISSFAIESARDLVNYMVRRGQMSQDEATQLLKEVEEAHAKRPQSHLPRLSEKVKAEKDAAKAAEKIRLEKEKAERMAALAAIKPVPKPKEPEKVEKPAEKQAEKPAEKVVAKAAPKPAAKAEPPKASEKPKVAAKPAAKAPAKPAAKAPAKSASKAAPKKK